MVDWNAFQEEVGEWSYDRFGDQPATNPFLGTAEEMAELTEEILTGNPDNEEVMDAIGDILVFFADYCNRAGVSYEEAAESRLSAELYTECETIQDLCVEITISRGNQAYSFLKQDQGIRSELEGVGEQADVRTLSHTLLALETFSDVQGFTLDEAIEEAWGEVKERDWNSSYN